MTELELFMNSLPAMRILADYPNLRSLSLQVQAIPQIVALDGMRHLQRLSMTECGMTSMEGLEHCRRLTFLDLSMNRIEAMEPTASLNAPPSRRCHSAPPKPPTTAGFGSAAAPPHAGGPHCTALSQRGGCGAAARQGRGRRRWLFPQRRIPACCRTWCSCRPSG